MMLTLTIVMIIALTSVIVASTIVTVTNDRHADQ